MVAAGGRGSATRGGGRRQTRKWKGERVRESESRGASAREQRLQSRRRTTSLLLSLSPSLACVRVSVCLPSLSLLLLLLLDARTPAPLACLRRQATGVAAAPALLPLSLDIPLHTRSLHRLLPPSFSRCLPLGIRARDAGMESVFRHSVR